MAGVIVTAGIALFCRDMDLLLKYSMYFGMGCVVLAGIFSGVFGDHYAMVFYQENREEREARWKRVFQLVALGAPAIASGLAIFAMKN